MAQTSTDLSSKKRRFNGKEVVADNREFILAQKEKGVSLERIAEQIGISTSTLQRHTTKWGLRRADIHFKPRKAKLLPAPVSPEIKRLAISQAWV